MPRTRKTKRLLGLVFFVRVFLPIAGKRHGQAGSPQELGNLLVRGTLHGKRLFQHSQKDGACEHALHPHLVHRHGQRRPGRKAAPRGAGSSTWSSLTDGWRSIPPTQSVFWPGCHSHGVFFPVCSAWMVRRVSSTERPVPRSLTTIERTVPLSSMMNVPRRAIPASSLRTL